MSKSMLMAGASAALALAAAPVVGALPAGSHPHLQKAEITIGAGDRVAEPNLALAPGVAVQITVVNRTHEFHTFTIPGLGVSELIRPAHGSTPGRTTVAFTPKHGGVFAWHCAICPSGKHGRSHTMDGALYVFVDPSDVG